MTTSAQPHLDQPFGRGDDNAGVADLIQQDQWASLRRSMRLAVPVNAVLSAVTLAVAVRNGLGELALPWFLAVSGVNVLRFIQARDTSILDRPSHHLRWAARLAAVSGALWASTPFLQGATGMGDGVFHLVVGAGITAGSIAMGVSYAPAAIRFVLPILVAHTAALATIGSFESSGLAVTVALYAVALCWSARNSERAFRATARLKHTATRMAVSLREAHDRSLFVAEEMSYRALHDPLTGLLNRAGFLRFLGERDDPAEPVQVLLLDLDGFKGINDAFGHKAGDQVLIEVARRITRTLPRDASVARLGGDEYAVALRPNEHRPTDLAQRLVDAIAEAPAFETARLSVSIGLYDGPWPGPADILAYADTALYEAKSTGRNRVCVFDDGLRRRLTIRRDSERDLSAALDSGAIHLCYQPILGGPDTLAAVEGLLRWDHPRHGRIAPTDIVAAAGLSGHSERLFGHIVDDACAMARRLREHGLTDVAVALNVSPREMSQLPVDRMVVERVTKAGLERGAVEIEITEETALDYKLVQGKLAALSDAGVRIAIDDFGVGYSSLSVLKQLRADRIKIDRSFVTGLTDSAEKRMLVQAIIGLGRALRLDVVAEGVETGEDALTLRLLGCQLMQGYHFGRPMPACEVLERFCQRTESRAASAA